MLCRNWNFINLRENKTKYRVFITLFLRSYQIILNVSLSVRNKEDEIISCGEKLFFVLSYIFKKKGWIWTMYGLIRKPILT